MVQLRFAVELAGIIPYHTIYETVYSCMERCKRKRKAVKDAAGIEVEV